MLAKSSGPSDDRCACVAWYSGDKTVMIMVKKSDEKCRIVVYSLKEIARLSK